MAPFSRRIAPFPQGEDRMRPGKRPGLRDFQMGKSCDKKKKKKGTATLEPSRVLRKNYSRGHALFSVRQVSVWSKSAVPCAAAARHVVCPVCVLQRAEGLLRPCGPNRQPMSRPRTSRIQAPPHGPFPATQPAFKALPPPAPPPQTIVGAKCSGFLVRGGMGVV